MAAWVDATIADVRRVAVEGSPYASHAVVLQAGDGRQLGIWIGPPEAVHLVLAIEQVALARPFTYPFVADLVRAAGAEVVEARITLLDGGIFHAAVEVRGAGGTSTVDARPSDALNLAAVTGAPIRVAAAIFDDPRIAEHDSWRDIGSARAAMAEEARLDLARALAGLSALPARNPRRRGWRL